MNRWNLNEFFDAWWFLNKHPEFKDKESPEIDQSIFNDMWVYVTKVNPLTNTIEDDEALNIETRVWLEWGPMEYVTDFDKPFWCGTHDVKLDCGGGTYEEAIIEMAKLVEKYYGNFPKE